MTIDKAKFRADLTEFASTQTFPDTAVTYWLNFAYVMLRQERWGADGTPGAPSVRDMGVEMFAAHNLVIEAASQRAIAVGNLPGIQTGAVSGKSVDRVSVSYDAQAGLVTDAGHWNLTVYGTRFIQLARMAGSGGIQITGGCEGFGLGGYPLGW